MMAALWAGMENVLYSLFKSAPLMAHYGSPAFSCLAPPPF